MAEGLQRFRAAQERKNLARLSDLQSELFSNRLSIAAVAKDW
jgi:hypothetical protein